MINVHYQQQIARQGLERPGLNGNNYRALNDVRVVIDESFNIYKSRARGFEPGNRNKFTGRNLWLPKCRPYGREFFLAYPSCTSMLLLLCVWNSGRRDLPEEKWVTTYKSPDAKIYSICALKDLLWNYSWRDLPENKWVLSVLRVQ